MEPLPGCAPPKVEYRQLDLGSLDSIRAFIRDFNRSGRPLDFLICNAGTVWIMPWAMLKNCACMARLHGMHMRGTLAWHAHDCLRSMC